MAFVALDFPAPSGKENSLFSDPGVTVLAKWTHKNLLGRGSCKKIGELEVTSKEVRDNGRGQFATFAQKLSFVRLQWLRCYPAQEL